MRDAGILGGAAVAVRGGRILAVGPAEDLARDYDPLTLNPFTIKKLLYNPGPLGRLIGRAYLAALETSSKLDDAGGEYVGRATMENIEHALQDLPEEAPRARLVLKPLPPRP